MGTVGYKAKVIFLKFVFEYVKVNFSVLML